MSDATDDRREGSDEDRPPREAVEEAERLTRLARSATDEDERRAHRERRAELLEGYDFAGRVREERSGDVLVLHPAEWHDGEVIRTDRIDDLSRAIEVPLEGAGDPDDWDDVDARNRALAEAVREAHGDVHGDNAAALADFMSNHYARPIESATEDELSEFRAEYFVRNAWPSADQRAAIEESIEFVFEAADRETPEFYSRR